MCHDGLLLVVSPAGVGRTLLSCAGERVAAVICCSAGGTFSSFLSAGSCMSNCPVVQTGRHAQYHWHSLLLLLLLKL